jgi:predicted nucleic acid-binding Zn ribbon protein
MIDRTCRVCGRPLKSDEKAYCPSCRSQKRERLKKAWDIAKKVGGGVLAVAVFIISIVSIDRGRQK